MLTKVILLVLLTAYPPQWLEDVLAQAVAIDQEIEQFFHLRSDRYMVRDVFVFSLLPFQS